MVEHIVPAEVFSPGEYLKDELEARGWTQKEFAEIIGRSSKLVNEIIAGKTSITPSTAVEIGAALGTGPMVWLNLENEFRLANAQPAARDIERKGRLRQEFPVRDLQKRGWVSSTGSVDELEKSVFDFYKIRSIEERSPLACAARRQDYSEPLTRLQEALLLRVCDLARGVHAKPYDEQTLRSRLGDLRSLMQEPEEVRHVPKLLAECGVRFVICESIAGSKLDGICTWLDANSPVIGMTLRHDRIDNFWFVLRHEIEHVLRRDGVGPDGLGAVFDDALEEQSGDLPLSEQAANAAAAEFCVPSAEMENWIARVGPLFSRDRVMGFAAIQKVHPGIVVGQLQRRLQRWDLFRPLLVRIRHLITQVAVTDGYGHLVAT
jgi:HTH-type transcriptional regulator/antitoxin HigA